MAKVKRIRTRAGTRYMRGGRFISAAAYRRGRGNPGRRKRRPRRRNQVIGLTHEQVMAMSPEELYSAYLSGRHTAKKAPTKKKAAKKKAAKKKTAKKATTKKKTAKKATTKKATTKKKTAKKAPTKKKTAKKTASRAAPAKKATTKKKTAKKAPSTKGKKKVAKKKAAAKSAGGKPGGRWTTGAWGKGKRKKVGTVSRKGVHFQAGWKKPHSDKRKKFKFRRARGKADKYTFRLIKNPVNAMGQALKKGGMFWAGLTGMRILNGYVGQWVGNKIPGGPQVAAIAPSAIGFLLSTAVLPKVMKGKNKTLVEALQMGSTMALISEAVKAFVPADSLTKLPLPVQNALSGYGQYVTVPMSAYVDYDNRLGEYVDYDNRYGGFEVSEALAADDLAYMQTGGAGGVFAKTSLGWG